MKVRSLCTTAAWLLLLPLCLHAQESAPKSRWVAGVGVGFSMNPYTPRDSVQGERGANLIPVEATLEYRLSRLFSLTASFSYGQLHTNSIKSQLLNTSLYPFFYSYRIQTATALIAPRLQFRIWQGDLGVALGIGRYRQWYDQKSNSVNDQQYLIKYKGVNNDFFSFRMDYTYWPQRRFGIAVGLETTDSFGGPGQNAFPEPRQPLPGGLEPQMAAFLQPRLAGYSSTTIWAGFRYRF